jgi:hypothetical protein
MPWFEYDERIASWPGGCEGGSLIVMGFDWMTWLETPEGQALSSDPAAIANARAPPISPARDRDRAGIDRGGNSAARSSPGSLRRSAAVRPRSGESGSRASSPTARGGNCDGLASGYPASTSPSPTQRPAPR